MIVYKADRIRFAVVKALVLPVLDYGEVRFTVEEAKSKAFPFAPHQQIRQALQARKPLEMYGITWVQTEGYAIQHQEFKWTWEPESRILQKLAAEPLYSVEDLLRDSNWRW